MAAAAAVAKSVEAGGEPGGGGGGAWSTVSRSGRSSYSAGGGVGGGKVGELAEGLAGVEIGGERRLDKYDIPVEVSGADVPPPADGFEAAGLVEAVLRNVARCGYESPTPVQRYSMPIALAGRDLMACAQTGSGKTAAFCLPVVSGLVAAGGSGIGHRERSSFNRAAAKPRALVLAPTRELAAQVTSSISSLSSFRFCAIRHCPECCLNKPPLRSWGARSRHVGRASVSSLFRCARSRSCSRLSRICITMSMLAPVRYCVVLSVVAARFVSASRRVRLCRRGASAYVRQVALFVSCLAVGVPWKLKLWNHALTCSGLRGCAQLGVACFASWRPRLQGVWPLFLIAQTVSRPMSCRLC